MNKIVKILWAIFLFTFPFSIRFLVYEDASYHFGHFNPWVAEFVYLPEILLGVVFILWIIERFTIKDLRFTFKFNWRWVLLLLFLINAGVVTFLWGDVVLFGFFLLRILEAGALYLLISNRLLAPKIVLRILLFGALFQIGWGFLQWKLNHSLGLTLLGEAVLGPDVLGVAKIDLNNGLKQIRAYGTFLHPNILAAYLLTILFISLSYFKKQNWFFWLIIMGGGIYLTHSRAAIMVGGLGLLLYLIFQIFQNKTIQRILNIGIIIALISANGWLFWNSHKIQINDPSWQARLEQNIISQKMNQAHPWGIGARNFTLEMENFTDKKLTPWEFQPVHNTYFLILNEMGIQGIILLIIMIGFMIMSFANPIKIIPLFILFFLASFDHFLWDSWVGVMLVGIVLGFLRVKHKIV